VGKRQTVCKVPQRPELGSLVSVPTRKERGVRKIHHYVHEGGTHSGLKGSVGGEGSKGLGWEKEVLPVLQRKCPGYTLAAVPLNSINANWPF